MAFLHNFLIFFYFLSSILSVNSLSTVSISETSNNQTLICALQPSNIQLGQANLNCTSFPSGFQIQMNIPNTSFSEIVGGNGFLCALRPASSSLTSIMGCWRFSGNFSNVSYKRIYRGNVIGNLDSGNSHVCGLVEGNSGLECWQWPEFNRSMARKFSSIAVGENFVCGLSEIGNITCLGSNMRVVGAEPTGNYSVISAGNRHACAISFNGSLNCWGEMEGEKPQGKFNSLALGGNRSCGLHPNGTVVCWGSNNFSMPERLQDTEFAAIVGKESVFCGVVSMNYSLHCWGSDVLENNNSLVFDEVFPGPCRNENQCRCGTLAGSAEFCDQGAICKLCDPQVTEAPLPLAPPDSSPSPEGGNNGWSNKMVAFLVVGCVGSVSLLSVLGLFLYRYCNGRGCRVHDSGPLDEFRNPEDAPQAQPVAPVLDKRLSHLISFGNGCHLEEFSLQVLHEATKNFSQEHKIGTGSFGSVYRATLEDGREIAIKRAENSSISPSYAILGGTKRQEDNDNAFVNELESLSRLNHKNLVGLLGYYEDNTERILVYEYMNNGNLNDHLHKLHSPPIMSWVARIKIALDAARGIQYLHEFAVPSVIHRDIKSANILLDVKWTAKVSDFGLSLMGPEDEESHLSLHAAGTVGYMDPEYYRLQQLSTKSDVYSFGVVLLELLSGYKAIHKNENGVPRNVVDFVVPYIVQDEIHRVLDPKLPPPTPFEIEAVAFVGYLAADCVTLEGRDRPSMTEIVNSLERALATCLAHPIFSRSTTGSSD